MQIEIRGNCKYELELFGRAYVITRAQLDELHELIESACAVTPAENLDAEEECGRERDESRRIGELER